MKFWLLTTAAALCFLKAASAQCSNDLCTGTDYRSYSSCLSNKCKDKIAAPDCHESKCSSVDCNTCSSSTSCCQSCCHSKCECSSFKCHTCSSSSSSVCCQTCCQKQDCCTSKKQEECCHTSPQQECCKDKPVPPANTSIAVHQTGPVIYNFLSQSSGGIKTVRESTHIETPTGTISHVPKPNQPPCCIITHQPPCPFPLPLFHYCPPPVRNVVCGHQCVIQNQVVIPPPPPVTQPVIQPPPQTIQSVFQPPPQTIQSVFQPTPQIIQPVIQPPPPIMGQPQLINVFPSERNLNGNSGRLPTSGSMHPRWGIRFFPALGAPGGYGGYGGFGGYIGQGGYGGYGVGAQPFFG